MCLCRRQAGLRSSRFALHSRKRSCIVGLSEVGPSQCRMAGLNHVVRRTLPNLLPHNPATIRIFANLEALVQLLQQHQQTNPSMSSRSPALRFPSHPPPASRQPTVNCASSSLGWSSEHLSTLMPKSSLQVGNQATGSKYIGVQYSCKLRNLDVDAIFAA